MDSTGGRADGDPEAGFRALFEVHFADVWSFARRRCQSAADADDITAETFAAAWRRWSDLPVGRERLWLFGAARRVLANQRRSADRLEGVRGRLSREPAPADSSPNGVSEGVGLWSALLSLSLEDRDLLVMRAWDELAVTEIATLLECTPNAVSLRLHRARRRLSEAMGAERLTDRHRSRTRTGRPPNANGVPS